MQGTFTMLKKMETDFLNQDPKI